MMDTIKHFYLSGNKFQLSFPETEKGVLIYWDDHREPRESFRLPLSFAKMSDLLAGYQDGIHSMSGWMALEDESENWVMRGMPTLMIEDGLLTQITLWNSIYLDRSVPYQYREECKIGKVVMKIKAGMVDE